MPHVATHITQQEIADRTRTFLSKRISAQIDRASLIHDDYASLWRSIESMVQTGGKYMRPYLLALSYKAADADAELDDIMPALGAIELLNLSLLIHDDIIDRDDVRYGIRNISGQRSDEYLTLIDDERDREHFAHSAALLAGDLTLSLAHQLLAECDVAPQILRNSTDIFYEGIFRVAGGELLDTESAFRGANRADTSLIAHEKTASYSVCLPLKLGAALASAPVGYLGQLDSIGSLLGEAYQLQDDILGTFGEETLTGKTVDGDLREGKRTYLIEYFYEHADDFEKAELECSFQVHDASNEDFERARRVLRSSGALAAVEERIDELTRIAISEIEQLGWPREFIDQLGQFAKKSTRRKK